MAFMIQTLRGLHEAYFTEGPAEVGFYPRPNWICIGQEYTQKERNIPIPFRNMNTWAQLADSILCTPFHNFPGFAVFFLYGPAACYKQGVATKIHTPAHCNLIGRSMTAHFLCEAALFGNFPHNTPSTPQVKTRHV